MRWWRVARAMLFTLALLFIAGEVFLRMFGMRQYPVFYSDPRYEYMTAPDQDVHPGMIHFVTNELGMRCGPIGKKKGRRVLVIGDSVINGGYQTTQDALATEMAAKTSNAQLLNCSAASWGPDNAAAFLHAHGTFDADLMIALFSSHDAFDRMTFEPLVGVHPSYPDRKPQLAWGMFIAKLKYMAGMYPGAEKPRIFNEGWKQLAVQVRQAHIPLVVMLHPEIKELKRHRYDQRGRQLLDSLAAWNVPVVRMIDHMDTAMYTDRIHVNDEGQRAIAKAMEQVIIGAEAK